MVPDVGQVPYEQHEKLFPSPVSELECSLQTWLFFGLLAELLGTLYDHDTFVVKSAHDGDPILSTKELEALIKKRIAWIATQENTTQKQFYEHAGKCIDIIWKALRMDFNPTVKYSIASVAEFLASAIDKARLTAFPGVVRCQKPFAKGFYTKEIKDRMVGAHWCPSDIVRVVDNFENIQMLHFFSRMKKPLGKVHHRDCTVNRCVAHSNSLSEYKKRHTEDCANTDHCEDVSIDEKPIMDILQTEALPPLQISRKDDDPHKISVQLCTSAAEQNSYVAVSHVWSDGMGNHVANSLPPCQLARLSDIVGGTTEKGQRPRILLDTFCCPVDPVAKHIALSLMRRTYLEAKKVLVLDSSLYCYNGQDLHPAEVTARILTSPWMRRLWTLQEGALSQGGSLWIYFKDGPIHMIHFWNRVFLLSIEDLKYRRLLHDTLKDTLPLSIDNYHFPNGTPNLDLLDRALSHRTQQCPQMKHSALQL